MSENGEPPGAASLTKNDDNRDMPSAFIPRRIPIPTIATTPPPAVAGMDAQERARQLYRGEILAPMVRASTTPLRVLALKYGADAVYTEELVDRSITGTIRVHNHSMNTVDYVKDVTGASAKTLRRLEREGGPPLLLRIDPALERGKLICQIGSGEPELALAAALHIHRDVDAIDLNMGCPKKFSVSGGMGSALLSDPDRACRILRTLKDNLPPHIPVSAKIRLLSDNNKTMDFITGLMERGGANALAIHGRTVGHDSVDPADWGRLEEIVQLTKAKYPHIPVLINGDFYTRREFVDFQQRSGADGVLLGRPALYNVSIFCKPNNNNNNSPTIAPGDFGYNSTLLLDKTAVIQEYLRQSVHYEIHYKNIKYVICEMMNNRRAPSSRVPFLTQYYPGYQTIGKTCACQSLEELCHVWDLDYNAVIMGGVRAGTGSLMTPASPSPSPSSQLLVKHQQALPAGEHKYDDGYLLQTMGPVADNNTSNNPTMSKVSLPLFTAAPSHNKRARLET